MRLIISSTILAVMLLYSCNKTSKVFQTIQGEALGTTYHITYQSDSIDKEELEQDIERLLSDFDNSLSVFNPNSTLSQINKNEDLESDLWIEHCFNMAQQVSIKSDGYFDITLRPLIYAYGFSSNKSQPKTLQKSDIDSIMEFVGYNKISIKNHTVIKQDPRIEMDFNAIAKGYSVDLVSEILDTLGVKNYMVEIGGEIFARGVNSKGKLWQIGVDKPIEGNYTPGAELQEVLTLSERGMATSGNYRNFYVNDQGEKISHTINPKTGKPSHHTLLSATIIAPTCAIADAYATASMAMGLDKALVMIDQDPTLSGYFIYSKGDSMMVVTSKRFVK